jgi:ribosomal protein L29
MKSNDIKLLHSKSVDELVKQAKELEVEISKLKKELIDKKLKNTSLIKTKSDDLARVKTLLNLKK